MCVLKRERGSYVCVMRRKRDSYACVIRRKRCPYMCDVHIYVSRGTGDESLSRGARDNHICVVTLSYVCHACVSHDSFMCVIHVCVMTQS